MEANALQKLNGQVFTPTHIVRNMLDYCGYCSSLILGKHLIDNSCGAGAFLTEAADRYCAAFLQHSSNKEQLAYELQTYLHGIEIEPVAVTLCRKNLDQVARKWGLNAVQWNIQEADALTVTSYHHKMDYVVGNPPYVRVHNLQDKYKAVKQFHFAQNGMTDLYLVFYEIGLQMLNSTGKLCYIAPSSWLNSLAGIGLRQYICTHTTLAELIDLGHYQPFENATAYTLIALFEQEHNSNTFAYSHYDAPTNTKQLVDNLTIDEIAIDKEFYLASHTDLQQLRKIKQTHPQHCIVKNGFATLADDFFITNLPFDDYCIPILKASTGKWYRGLFPYDAQGNPISWDTLCQTPAIKAYYLQHQTELLKGRTTHQCADWYLYGRTQALRDVSKNKIAVNTIIKDTNSLKLNLVPAGSGLYSGLYLLTKHSLQEIEAILRTEAFINYLRMLKKYKSGGYYTFNSKDLEQYLNYHLSLYENNEHPLPARQQSLFECLNECL